MNVLLLFEMGIFSRFCHKFFYKFDDSSARPPFRKRRAPTYVLLFYVLSDILSGVCSFTAALATADLFNLLFYQHSIDTSVVTNVQHITQFVFILLGVLFWFGYRRHYSLRMPFWQEAKDVLVISSLALVIEGFFQFATKQDFSRSWIMMSWVYFALGAVVFRVILRVLLRRFGLWQVPTLLIGKSFAAENVLSALKSEPSMGYDITTHLYDMPAISTLSGHTWKDLFLKHGVDYVIIALDAPSLEKNEDALHQLVGESLPFSIVPPLPTQLPVSAIEPHFFYDNDIVLFATLRGLQHPMARFIKRVMDVCVSALALLALSPVFIVLSAIIRLDGGQALFGHKRLGMNGQSFKCLKFRSMVMNSAAVLEDYLKKNPEAAKAWQEEWKLRDDPRITRVGHFIRKWSLDELPQLINVLRGDMSLVGPRPIVFQETSKYSDDLQYYYSVRPGLTGLWQVSGRNDVSYPMRVHMDSWYVRNWSVWHDIVILFKTVRVLLNRAGAY